MPFSPDQAPKPARDLRRTSAARDHWYPVAQSGELDAGAALGARFAGDPIVLVRPSRGAPFALEDRCAHRQVPLHSGVVKGERLQCTYHCWTYDRSGRCVSVPYLDAACTLPNGVRAYPLREAYGLLWVFPGDPRKAASAWFPDIPAYEDPQYKLRRLDRRIGCHYSFMHENLMDMNHQFLHRKLMGKVRATLIDLIETSTSVEAQYSFARISGRQSFGEKIMIGAVRRRPEQRDANVMRIVTHYPHQWLTFQLADADKPALVLWNFYTPLDRAERSNRTLGLMLIRRPMKLAGPFRAVALDAAWPLVRWFTESIFAEDQTIVEQEQAAFEAQGADWNQEINPPILALRELLLRCGGPLEEARPDRAGSGRSVHRA